MAKNKTSSILITPPSPGYELLDSGDGEKLERFGTVVLSRPDPQALWPKKLSAAEWKKADGVFGREEKVRPEGRSEGTGGWSLKPGTPAKWNIDFAGLKFIIKPTAFKHTGIFPEQAANWEWMKKQIENVKIKMKNVGADEIEVLNLFGYTGGATLACAQAGAKVVHIDSSKAAVAWARENAELSGLADKPIRWIVEDARVFVEREAKRGRNYDAIIMDPPAFGHGPATELWKIEEHFIALIEACKNILKDQPLFFVINGYSAGYSAVAYENNLLDLKAKYGGEIETGELAIEEKDGDKSQVASEKMQTRLLPAGIFARWAA